ncbi:equilibrative nucleoside transporter 1a [Erpetoichthys calabaricus]|uniref:Solute carrier family 29 member 1b n=1 Tax=Erpetoichthys calabaricus TaxID=27687 RepID=A0A8C4TAP1_ERPCA|nr:equilibrative nucleoside transporter 1a [Erpetoichthys calabaricus]XP_028676017.1 equilibrative nucleoside transporter 1a [Erpetoichthys calabaricus]XP_028676020.1 equilibrative nucleoside transporter 1a [Erpetoichthys calabaricus]XP_028676022.1 equilibrative nucleoside transporter 1a [Erpetoichthys calabaricus]XP_051775172.1 equilibrative nucleoside transporter 1a [Erpetoichthys calabaricus]XP_051775173.1 equilibrative nucleoside transporter 1a [Erpetoichthys calabaricus]XP_051775174.1 eq
MTATVPPEDKYKAVWLIFFILGLGTLLPWNFFMTATMYFTERLATPQVEGLANTTANGTSLNYLQSKFSNVMTLCAMVPLLVFTCLNSFLHQKIPQKIRIMGSLFVILLVFVLTAAFVKIPIPAVEFFTLTMIKIVCINSFGAVLQGSLFGLAGLLPASYTTPIMSGQGLAGTFAAFSMICAIASGSELQDSAFGYFITACVVIIIAIFSYVALPKMEFCQYYANKDNSPSGANSDMDNRLDLLKKDNTNGIEKNIPEEHNTPTVSVFAIFKKIWVMALSVCFVFTVTIGVFPAVTVDVKSSSEENSTWSKYFIPVSCFLLFNLCDWAGRSLTAFVLWPGKDSLLLPIMVIGRVVFIPLFMLCNVLPRSHLPVFFLHDAWYIIFMILFASTNGYLASLCMCYGPKKVSSHEGETAGAIMAFFLSLGLALGAATSFLFRAVV